MAVNKEDWDKIIDGKVNEITARKLGGVVQIIIDLTAMSKFYGKLTHDCEVNNKEITNWATYFLGGFSGKIIQICELLGIDWENIKPKSFLEL